MTRPRTPGERPPLVATMPVLRTSAGVPIAVPVTITNQADEPRVFVVSAMGVDTTWVPMPAQSTVVAPGDSIDAELTLRPADGTLAARYPLVIAVQALDPATGAARTVSTVDDIDLIVDAPGQIAVSLDPPDSRAIYSRKFFVVLQNSGLQVETVHLDARAPYSTAVDVTRHPIVVPPQATVRVPGRLTVSRPTLFRRNIRHAFSVTARTSAAPKHVEGSLTARSLIGPTGAKVVAVLVVIAVWVALALVFVPKLADKLRKPSNNAGAQQTLTVKPPAGGKGGKKGGGSGGGSGGSGGGGEGPAGSGSSGGGGAGGAAAGATATTVQLNGTVSGAAPAGVTVSLSPTSFGSGDAQPGSGTGSSTATQAADEGPIGKLTPEALMPEAFSSARRLPTSDSSVTTGSDGAWSFRNVKIIGYYTLQFSKPGYQTQRFIIDPTSATVSQPMKVTLVPGTGALHGVVHNAAGGLVGGATITITDGTNTITTSSISTGHGIGTWSVTGLSTPSSYLVSASHDGLGVASRLVSLAASGTGTVDLSMSSAMATVSGFVHTFNGGHDGGLGAVQISASNGSDTRSAITDTTGDQRGTFVLPDLPVGTWVVTATIDGYQIQSRSIKVAAGKTKLSVNMALVPSTVDVIGTVRGLNGPTIPGAGLVLSNATNTYKQTSVGQGRFHFGNVAPGTYTLSAQYFGYQPTTLTVVGTAGKTTPMVHIAMPVQHTSYSSVIAGYAGNAASSSGSLGCQYDGIPTPTSPQGTPVLGCFVYFSLYDTQTRGVIDMTLKSGGQNGARPGGAVSANGPTLYMLSHTPQLPDHSDGLAPGRYQLTISSAGYLPATVNLDVPLNGTASAPQVNLLPANSIGGHVSSIGVINGDGVPGPATEGQNCVVAVPHGYDPTVFDPANFSCDQTKVPVGGFGPSTLTALEQNCTAVGLPEPQFGMLANDGKYTINGLCDGQYNVYLVIGNSAYDPGAVNVPLQSVAHGQSIDYSPTLPRRPLLDLMIRQLDTATGQVSPLPSTPVTVTCDTAATATTSDQTTVVSTTTDGNGIAELWGVPAGDVTCTVSTQGAEDAGTGTFATVDDQTYTPTATKVGTLPAEFGQVVSTYGSSDENPVRDALVDVTGTIKYVGANPVVSDPPVEVHTNQYGCYAVTTTGTLSSTDSVPTGCGSLSDFTADNIAKMPLRSTHVSVTVGATTPTQAVTSATNVVLQQASEVDSTHPMNPVFAKAIPVSTAGLTVTSVPSGLPLTNVLVKVEDFSATAHGAGTITAGINSSSQLTWADSTQSIGGLATQGTYVLDVSANGFSDLKATLDCGVHSAALSCTLSPFSINALTELHGVVTGPSLTPPHGNTQLNGAVVYAIPCSTSTCDTAVPSTTSNSCPPPPNGAYQTTTNSSGVFDFIQPSGRFLPRDTYELVVCAPNMVTQYVLGYDATVGGDHSIPSASTTLQLLGGVSGTVVGSNDTGTGLSGAALTLFRCDTGACSTQVATTTTDPSGNFVFSNASGRYFLTLGDYKLTVVQDGYRLDPIMFTVQGGDSNTANLPGTPIVMTAKGALGGLVTVLNDVTNKPVAGATVALYTCTVGPLVCSTSPLATAVTNGSGNYQFTGAGTSSRYFLESGRYKITASLPGYAPFANDDVIVNSGDNTGVGDFQMTRLGTFHGKITDNLTGNPGVSGAVVQLDKCALDTDTTCANLLTGVGDSYQAVTDPVGQYSFVSLGNPNLFLPGEWQMTVTEPGHRTLVQVLTLTSNDNTPDASAQVMSVKGAIGGTVTNDDATPAPLSNSTVDLYGCTGTTLGTCGGPKLATTTTNPDGTYQLNGASGKYFLADGAYEVTVTAAGYATKNTLATVTSDGVAVYVPAPVNVTMSRLAALQGVVNDTTTGNPVVPGATVTVVPCLVPDAAVCDPDTDASHAKTIVTDSSGQFAFAEFGSPYVFSPGHWQVTITAPGHVTSAATTVVLTNGVNSLAANSSTTTWRLPYLVAYGSVTGIVRGTGNQQLSGAVVTAHSCPSGFDTTTTDVATIEAACTGTGGLGTAPTATTNLGGAYTFSGTISPWALPPGVWAFTATAFGYLDGATVATVASGVNNGTGFDVNESVRTVTQTIQVAIDTGVSKYTNHATVTLSRTDDPSNQPTVTRPTGSGTIFSAAGLYYGSYLVDIKSDGSTLGNRIQESTFTLYVPLVDALHTNRGPAIFAPAIARTSLTGTVSGATGDASSAPVPAGVPVALFPAGDHSAVAMNLADEPLIATTGTGGVFLLTQIPTGTYDVVINDVSSLTSAQQTQFPSNPAYGSTAVNGLTIVGNSPPQSIGGATLTRTTGQVQVTVNYDSAEDLNGGTGTLSSSGWSARTATTTTGGGPSATSKTFTFSNVPWGCWSFSLPWTASVHTGGVSRTDSGASCISLAAPTATTASSATAVYKLDEHKLVITPTITPNSPADAASTPSFTLTLKNSSAATVYTTTVATPTSAITLYLPSDTYTLTMARPSSGVSADMWPTDPSWSQSIDLTSASQTGITVSATEAHLATLKIPTYSSGGTHADATHVLSITLSCTAHQGVPAGCDGSPTTVTASDNGSGTTTLQLAPGAWELTLSGTGIGPGSSTPTVNVSKVLTLSAGGTTTVSW